MRKKSKNNGTVEIGFVTPPHICTWRRDGPFSKVSMIGLFPTREMNQFIRLVGDLPLTNSYKLTCLIGARKIKVQLIPLLNLAKCLQLEHRSAILMVNKIFVCNFTCVICILGRCLTFVTIYVFVETVFLCITEEENFVCSARTNLHSQICGFLWLGGDPEHQRTQYFVGNYVYICKYLYHSKSHWKMFYYKKKGCPLQLKKYTYFSI